MAWDDVGSHKRGRALRARYGGQGCPGGERPADPRRPRPDMAPAGPACFPRAWWRCRGSNCLCFYVAGASLVLRSLHLGDPQVCAGVSAASSLHLEPSVLAEEHLFRGFVSRLF